MSKRILSDGNIREMLANARVAKCTSKSIAYTPTFKLEAVHKYEAGLSAREIFARAGINLLILDPDHPRECLKRWRKIVKRKGLGALREENRGKSGGRPRTRNLTDKQRIEYLEAKVAYLRAENDFLAKLRAKRAESNSGLKKNTP